MNTDSSIVKTNTKRFKANATRGKRGAASNAAAGRSAAANVAALCVQLHYSIYRLYYCAVCLMRR